MADVPCEASFDSNPPLCKLKKKTSSSLHSELIFIVFRINLAPPRIIVTTSAVAISSIGAGKEGRKKERK
jgi:hypothetical protein